jgi:putative hemolysin
MPRDQLQTEDKASGSSPFFAGLRNIPALTEKFLHGEKVQEFYRWAQNGAIFPMQSKASEKDLQLEAADIARVPSSGPVVVIVNHHAGMLDGSQLASLLRRVRPDVKVLSYPKRYPSPRLRQHQFDSQNLFLRSSEIEALAWLRSGGMLAVALGQEISPWQFSAAQKVSPARHNLPVRLIRQTRAVALPLYICGYNPALDFFGSLRPVFKNRSPELEFPWQERREQERREVEVRVGGEISPDSIASIGDDAEAAEYLKWRTYLLARRSRSATSWPVAMRSKIAATVQQPAAAAEAGQLLSAELSRLPSERKLVESGALTAYLARAGEIPTLMRELGRLREITFRCAGEGTGKSRDLDRFDRYYSHILLWNKSKQELVGAYRAGDTAEILARHGVKGLYTSSLFRYDLQFFEKLGPALELGRSFVRPEYQRQYAPLLLLWKAIARLLAMRPEIAVVFGPVSISNDYSKASREMIYRFFEALMQEDELAGMIAPRKPFRPAGLRPWDCPAMCHALRDLEDLSKPITVVESDGKGLPILLRQYAKIGGKLLGFNVDRKFSNVLDGLMVVDLRKTEPAVLERYMGREAAAQFRRKHGLRS